MTLARPLGIDSRANLPRPTDGVKLWSFNSNGYAFPRNSREINAAHSMLIEPTDNRKITITITKEIEMSIHNRIFATASVLVLLGTLPGCATFNRCGLSVCPDDAKITANVEARLRQDTVTPFANSLYVSTTDHVVYLNGIVDSRGEKAQAETDARETAGVTDVVNGIVGHFP